MSAPNVEGSSNPTATGGNNMGIEVGGNASETLGFYGHAGVAQQSSSGITTVAGVVAALVALGLLSA